MRRRAGRVTRFVLLHSFDNGAALLIRRRQARQMTIEVRFNLPFGFGENSGVISVKR